MTRTYTGPGECGGPEIDKKSVSSFFDKRAEKIESVGPLHAVIYQDKDSDLALNRDIAEKQKLLPLLQLSGSERLLDVGCGTGRWAKNLIPVTASYYGIDACEGLVEYSRQHFSSENSSFFVASADDFSLHTLGVVEPFDRVLCAGVLIYLNDTELGNALRCIANAIAPGGLILLREPVGLGRRLTISEHFSEDMEQYYNAIYRTREELEAFIRTEMPAPNFRFVGAGDVYDDRVLNNRSDTRQCWFLLERNR
ncbi:methyltransferase [Halopseudomonas oceani]|uniref:Methyltransferase type 12 n=1 Tax=Halopseudomonas oceani TaxID=1708783 RepID=A0A2P4EY54_9GAMM|nr:class I SAM-dependent methyltransferase [Halopseudomonas oceani]POB05154.1 methyltransferase type 12 [Halopseudomonas oceani]GGE33589.1 methyltransferase [Halopseudomonas oceani]